MNALEYLDFFGEIQGLSRQMRRSRSDYLLDYFGLSPAAARRIGEYSKGMRQKLALARALMHEPPVLLLDEPTSAMDPESARLVRDEIARLRSTQRTIIICTHNLAEAEALSDTIAIIYRGRVLLTGTLEQLKQRVLGRAEYEARLAGPWHLDGMKIPAGVNLVAQTDSLMRFQVDEPEVSNPYLLRELAMRRAPLVSFQEVPRSLEQVYLRVMAEAQAPAAEAARAA